jgi:hypothetical protein
MYNFLSLFPQNLEICVSPRKKSKRRNLVSITYNFNNYGRKDRIYHFACGATMNSLEMKRFSISPKIITNARLKGHRLSFHGFNPNFGGGLETVLESKEMDLWGVVYSLSFHEALALDFHHNVRLDGAGTYFHYPVDVEDLGGGVHTVLLYKLDVLGPEVPPSKRYLDYILDGAKEQKLPSSYINQLEKTLCLLGNCQPHSGIQRSFQGDFNCLECLA